MAWILIFITIGAQVPLKQGTDLTLEMHERFAYSAMMRTALIHGFTDRAARHAGQLAEVLEDPQLGELKALAQDAAEADDVETMAMAVAGIANGCGSCHQANKVQPMFLGQRIPPQGDSLAARMGRHIWAADRMWEGLISHSEDSWRRGTEVLRDRPFFAGPDAADLPANRIDQIMVISSEAARTTGWDDRAKIYGRFLAACSGCHQTYAAGPN